MALNGLISWVMSTAQHSGLFAIIAPKSCHHLSTSAMPSMSVMVSARLIVSGHFRVNEEHAEMQSR